MSFGGGESGKEELKKTERRKLGFYSVFDFLFCFNNFVRAASSFNYLSVQLRLPVLLISSHFCFCFFYFVSI